MICEPVSKRTGWLLASLMMGLVIGLYTVMSVRQHKINPLDRTIPTWTQLGQGVVALCQKNDEEKDARDLLAAALGEAQPTKPIIEKSFWEGRILWEASKATLLRLFYGLGIGILGGLLIGVLMGCIMGVDAGLSPIMYFFSRIIPTAAMPIFFKVTGIEIEMYISMIAFGAMPIVTLTVSSYIKDFPNELRYKAYTLGASHLEVVTTTIIPYILPKVLDLIVLMIGPALVYLIAAEQIVAPEGFGYRIRVLTKATRFEMVYPLIVILTLYAATLTVILKAIKKWLCPWACRAGVS